MFLTHRDDVGDHEQWAEALGCRRIIHSLEANARQKTDQVEWKLDGEGPWRLDDGEDDVEVLFTPGHTRGCLSLLYTKDQALFTGDHLAYSTRLDRLTIFRAYNWYDVGLQCESVAKLLGYDFVHILPGHGRRMSFETSEEAKEAIVHCLKEEGWKGLVATTTM